MSDSLTHRTIKNSTYSLIGFIWPLLLSFVATPIIINTLGSARFGFYTLLNSVPVVFGLLDFGLSYTFIKFMSENREQKGGGGISVTFSSTAILYALLGVIGMVSLLLFQGWFRVWFKIPGEFISSFNLAFFILGVTFFIQMLVVPLSQIPYALQRQDISTKISMINNTLLLGGSVVVLKTGHSVMSLLVIQLISASFLLLSYYFTWHYLAPDLKFIPKLSKKVVKTIGQQSFWLFIRNNMGNILAQLDKLVLGIIWGPTAVGYYSTALMIPEKISSTSFSLSHIFFPIFSEVSSQEQEGSLRVRTIFRRSLGVISIITSGLTVLVFLYGYQLLRYWVSSDFADRTVIAVPVLALTYFLLSFGNFFQAFLSGLQELKFLALSTTLIAIVDVVFIFILVPRYSVNGAAWAYLLSGLPMFYFLYYIERKYFTSQIKEILAFYGKAFSKIFIVCGIIFLISWWVFRPLATNLISTLFLGGVTFIFYLLVYWLLGFYNSDDTVLFKVYFNRFLSFFKPNR